MNEFSWGGLFYLYPNNNHTMALILQIQGDEQPDFTPSTDVLQYRNTYYPKPITRDVNVKTHKVELNDKNFVQFEFDDDTVWFSNSKEITKLFADSTVKTRDGAKEEITVIISSELGRDLITERGGGLKKVLLKVVRIFLRKETPGQAVVSLAADFERQVLETEPGLYSIGDDFSLSKFTTPAAASVQPYLLFLHGTMSSTMKSFGKMVDKQTWRNIKATYGNNVLGFQHRSLTESPLKNVLDLITLLPDNCTLHVVSQSHGGVVGEALSRFYNAVGGTQGFNNDELALFKKQPGDLQNIAAIKNAGKQIVIEKFIRCAGPAAGTTLASSHTENILNLLANTIGLVATVLYPALRHLLVAAVEQENNPNGGLPGLQALRPDSAFIQAINSAGGTQIDNALVIISGRDNYFHKRALVKLTGLFFPDDNDSIVNTVSMWSGTPRTKLVQYFRDEGTNVCHFNYFENDSTILKFEDALLKIPFGDPIPGFTAQPIVSASTIPWFGTREAPPVAVALAEPITLNKNYYVNVGPGGTFKPSGNAAYDTVPPDVDKIIGELKAKNNLNKVVLYFHGGLVSARSGMDTADRITSLVRQDAEAPYPIAFVWETGIIETLVANLKDLRETELFQKLLVKALKIAAKRLGIEIPDGTPGLASRGVDKLSDDQVAKELAKPEPFDNISVNTGTRSVNTDQDLTILEAQLNMEVQAEINKDRHLQDLIVRDKSETEKQNLNGQLLDATTKETRSRGIISTAQMVKSLATVIYRTVKRMIQKRDHGFYPTIIEEILREIYVANLGAWFWKQMKDKAAEMWLPDATQVPSADLTQHAGTYVLRSLNKYGDETNQDITMDLVGHSAGSIAVAELMSVLANYPRLKVRHIIYMAPAITSKLFKEKVMAYTGRFQTFRMFTMSDDYETKDMMLWYVYPRSLLYFISGCLENGFDEYILGMERYLKDVKPYNGDPLLNDIKTFLQTSPNMYVYAVTKQDAADGLQTLSEHHGDFDNDKPTLKSMMSIIMTP
jgi:hypothetical protein